MKPFVWQVSLRQAIHTLDAVVFLQPKTKLRGQEPALLSFGLYQATVLPLSRTFNGRASKAHGLYGYTKQPYRILATAIQQPTNAMRDIASPLLLLLYPRLISFEIYRGGGSMCQGWHIERWPGMDACLRGPLER